MVAAIQRQRTGGEMNTITLDDIKAVAKSENLDVLSAITLMQACAAKLKDSESTLNALCQIKSQVVANLGGT